MILHRLQDKRANSDIQRIFSQSYVWRELAWAEIRSSYRRSTLGTLWITATTGVFAITIGVIYGQFFGQDTRAYLPYFAISFVLWTFISASLTGASNAMISAGNYIKGSLLPIVFYPIKLVATQFIILLHNLIVAAVIWTIFRWPLSWISALSLLGLALTFVFICSCAVLISMVCVRFRDIPPLLQATVQFLFFATPIIWYPEQIRYGAAVLWLNPISYFLIVTRDPFLGRPVTLITWTGAVGFTVIAMALAYMAYIRYRSRIAYWV